MNGLITLFAAFTLVWPLGTQKLSDKPTFSVQEDTKKVMAILKVIDDHRLDMDTKMSVYSDEVVHMAQGNRPITNKADLRRLLEKEASFGHAVMKHELITLHSYHDMVLTRGRVKATWYPSNNGKAVPIETNNIITFRRMPDGSLKVWQVIFNLINLEN